MPERCLTAAELGDLCDRGNDDPRWGHVAACPRCRALVGSYRSFLAGDPALADEQAERELGRRLATLVSPAPPAAPRFRGRRGQVMAASLALAAVLATAMIVGRLPGDVDSREIVVRGGGGTEAAGPVLHEPAPASDGRWTFAWTPWPEADAYSVRFFGGDLRQILQCTVPGDTLLVLPAGDFGPGGDRYWQVEALRQGVVTASSPVTLLALP